jgi:uncharacterized protein (TIGR03083 family)
MSTQLGLDDHLVGLLANGAALRDAADQAGLRAKVPTCPEWDVTQLVTHQGVVHRWATANLRGEADHDTAASAEQAQAAAELLEWYTDGLAALVEALRRMGDDAPAMVFLNDAPPPRRFWARRQCHETAIHRVDARSAALGRWPTASDVQIDPLLAADGIDELLTGFITRGRGDLRAAIPYTLLVRSDDTPHAWTVRISDGPMVTTPGETDGPDVVFSGSAVQLYLSLWNRADEITTDRPDVLADRRSTIRVQWR